MAISLEAAEQEIATALTQAGLSRPAGVLAVVMATRAHARPEDELVEIVRQYPEFLKIQVRPAGQYAIF